MSMNFYGSAKLSLYLAEGECNARALPLDCVTMSIHRLRKNLIPFFADQRHPVAAILLRHYSVTGRARA
jgi:hypothetical protein